MYNYELLCLDGERTRSIWLTHAQELDAHHLAGMLDEVQADVPAELLRRWSKDSHELHKASLELGRSLNVAPEVMALLERRIPPEQPTFASVFDELVDRLCLAHGFRRLTPTAVVVRFGPTVLAA